MIHITDLQTLKLDEITSEPLKKAVQNLLDDYKKEPDKDFFEKTARENIEKLFTLVKSHSPQAIPVKKTERSNKEQPKKKPSKPKPDKATSKKTMEELKALEPKLAACRKVIREHNQKKREAQGTKPKKNRYTKLKERLLTLVSLIPDTLKDEATVQQKTETILLSTHTRLVEAWGMSKLKAKHGAAAIKDKFEAMEEKTEKKTTAKTPDKKEVLDVIMAYKGVKREGRFMHKIELDAFPKAKDLKKGDTIKMGEYGILNDIVFFNSQLYPHDREEGDHDQLEIVAISKRLL